MGLSYLSVCSGIEAATVAWHPLGFKAAGFSEIEPFPSAVLAHHYPSVPNFGDMTKFKEWPDADIDILVGGTPCQSFSVAGLRKGLDDPRGNLALVYLAIAERFRPKWVVWENVPGVLSSNGGRDFGAFLGGLGQLGYGWAYRILDAQYVRVESHPRAVPQRRRRVFVIGYLGDWRRAAAVLFERESLSGHPAPRRQTGQGLAPTLSARTKGGGGLGTDFDCDGGLVAHALCAEAFDASEDGSGRGTPLVPDVCPALKARDYKGPSSDGDGDGDGAALVVFDCKASGRNGFGVGDISPTLRAMGHANSHQNAGGQVAFADSMAVRRLTPRECERLQGFPDDYTLIPYRNKQAADGPRYKALGNSMAVPCMRWIGSRIQGAMTCAP